jgi:hypothetical protein
MPQAYTEPAAAQSRSRALRVGHEPSYASCPMRPSVTLAFALTSLAGSTLAHAEPPSAPEPAASPVSVDQPEHPAPWTRLTTIGAGVGMTAVWYGAAAGISYEFPDAPGARDLRLPVVGPWLAIAHNGCADTEPDCSTTWVVMRTILTAIDGIGQAGGPLIVLEGILMRTEEPPSTPSTPGKAPGTAPVPSDNGKNLLWLPLPRTVGSRGIGLGISGRF